MEHFSRLTTRDVDLLFVVSDPSRRGILTAVRIRDLIHELDLRIARDVLIINRVQGELDPEVAEEAKKQNLPLAGIIPVDDEIYRYDLEGKPTFQLSVETPSVQAARRIFEEYIQ